MRYFWHILSVFIAVALLLIDAKPYSVCKEVSENRTYPDRKLYIFSLEGRPDYLFHKFVHIWKWTAYKLHFEKSATVKVVRAKWDSKSLKKFLTKPTNYLKHVDEAIQEEKRLGRNIDDAHVILVDSDTLFSNPNIDDIWQRYDCARQGKSLVVASEPCCWLGRYCSESDINTWYKSTPEAYSVFVNSGAIMGTLSTVRDMLINVTTNSDLYFIETHKGVQFDDQYAVAAYAMERPSIAALDIHQSLFGTYQLFDPLSTGTTSPYVCRQSDGPTTNYNYHCNDITNQEKIVYIDDKCAVRRVAGGTRYQSITNVLKTLAPDPILWHGNGGGKRMYARHRVKLWDCFVDKYHINKTAYSCDSNGCGENIVGNPNPKYIWSQSGVSMPSHRAKRNS
jgi:hypothetical protein